MNYDFSHHVIFKARSAHAVALYRYCITVTPLPNKSAACSCPIVASNKKIAYHFEIIKHRQKFWTKPYMHTCKIINNKNKLFFNEKKKKWQWKCKPTLKCITAFCIWECAELKLLNKLSSWCPDRHLNWASVCHLTGLKCPASCLVKTSSCVDPVITPRCTLPGHPLRHGVMATNINTAQTQTHLHFLDALNPPHRGCGEIKTRKAV